MDPPTPQDGDASAGCMIPVTRGGSEPSREPLDAAPSSELPRGPEARRRVGTAGRPAGAAATRGSRSFPVSRKLGEAPAAAAGAAPAPAAAP